MIRVTRWSLKLSNWSNVQLNYMNFVFDAKRLNVARHNTPKKNKKHILFRNTVQRCVKKQKFKQQKLRISCCHHLCSSPLFVEAPCFSSCVSRTGHLLAFRALRGYHEGLAWTQVNPFPRTAALRCWSSWARNVSQCVQPMAQHQPPMHNAL